MSHPREPVVHVCKRCLYRTRQKIALRAHLSRKTPCAVVEGGQDIDIQTLYEELGELRTRKYNVECEKCGKKYSSVSNLCHHRKKCTGQNQTPVQVESQSSALEAIIERIVEKRVENVLRNLQPSHQNNVHVGGNMITNNQIHINIHAHGSENLAYLEGDFLTSCAKTLYDEGLPTLLGSVHMHPDHPENHNIKAVSKRQRVFQIYDGKCWKMRNASSVLDELMQKGCKVLYKHLINNLDREEFQDEQIQEKIDAQILDLIDVTKKRKSDTYYKIRDNLYLMFLEDKPDSFAIVQGPQGQDIVENTLNAIAEQENDD